MKLSNGQSPSAGGGRFQAAVSMVSRAAETGTRDADAARVVECIRSGKWRKPVERVRAAVAKVLAETGDPRAAKKAADPLKKALPGVCFSGTFARRASDALKRHSGLLCADLDELGDRLPEVFRLLSADPHAFAVFISPTGRGIKAVFRVPADGTKHEASFRAVQAHVHELTGADVDESCCDVARLCFVSFDVDAHLNRDAVELAPLASEPKAERPKAPTPMPRSIGAGAVNLAARRAVAEGLFGAVRWTSDTEGFCECPGKAAHTTGNGARDCQLRLDGAPTATCFHDSCRDAVDAANHELRSRIGKAEHGADEEAFAALVKLSPTDYDRRRESEADRLGIRTSTLDAEVSARRPKLSHMKPDPRTVRLLAWSLVVFALLRCTPWSSGAGPDTATNRPPGFDKLNLGLKGETNQATNLKGQLQERDAKARKSADRPAAGDASPQSLPKRDAATGSHSDKDPRTNQIGGIALEEDRDGFGGIALDRKGSDVFDIAELMFKAKEGDAVAQFNLASRYEQGDGVPKDDQEAAKWYRKAADQGHVEAMSELGFCLIRGDGVATNKAEGIRLLAKAAEKGNLRSANRLGFHYALGKASDAQAAIRWFRFSADRGDASAQHSLGVGFSLGGWLPFGARFEKDLPEAAKWYKRAALQGHADSQLSLAEMYAEGDGVMQDFVEAFKWFNIAAASSEGLHWDIFTPATRETAKKLFRPVSERAKLARDRLSELMTPAQIAEGQRRSVMFLARKETGPDSTPGLSEDLIPSAPKGSGTGFFITEDGYLVTNYHVVEQAQQVRLLTARGLLSASVVKTDAANDLAVFKAQGEFTALPLAPSRGVKLGDTVATVGFPNIGLQGFAPKLTRGEISSLTGAQDDARQSQISVPVQPGNSGGALVDARGNVVGVVVGKLSQAAALRTSGALAENVNYAVKSSFLLSFLESLPGVSARLKEPNTKDRKFEDVVNSAEQAAVLVLVY